MHCHCMFHTPCHMLTHLQASGNSPKNWAQVTEMVWEDEAEAPVANGAAAAANGGAGADADADEPMAEAAEEPAAAPAAAKSAARARAGSPAQSASSAKVEPQAYCRDTHKHSCSISMYISRDARQSRCWDVSCCSIQASCTNSITLGQGLLCSTGSGSHRPWADGFRTSLGCRLTPESFSPRFAGLGRQRARQQPGKEGFRQGLWRRRQGLRRR